MKTPFAVLLTVILSLFFTLDALAQAGWVKYPRQPGELDAYIKHPPSFKVIKPQAKPPREAMLNVRVRSPEGEVEFAYTGLSARGMPGTVAARVIPLPLANGERIVSQTPTQRKVRGEHGDYIVYEEDITVAGPNGAYTRHFRRELSTSNLPGAASEMWEYKVTGDQALKKYQDIYRQFKKTLELGEF